jgi:hypothetical protein
MDSREWFGVTLLAGGSNPPGPDNDNWRLMEAWRTPAEFMQWVRLEKERLRQEIAEDLRLLACPEHRLTREITLAMEQCCLWHYYGER